MGESTPVLNDPQFGLTTIMRPYVGFDGQTGATESYQGVAGNEPIMFSENGIVRDPQAGKPGYSKRLLKGLSVPFGARVSVWLPAIFPNADVNIAPTYQWLFIWRQRNVFDYRAQRIAFHYPKQGAGAPDPTVGDQPPERVIIPAASHAVILNDPSPTEGTTGTYNGARAKTYAEAFIVTKTNQMRTLPRAPAVPGIVPPDPQSVIGQGLLNGAGGLLSAGYFPMFHVVELQALGDELLIACTKAEIPVGGSSNWDFTADDIVFSFYFGAPPQPNAALLTGGPFPDLGVFVNVGVAT